MKEQEQKKISELQKIRDIIVNDFIKNTIKIALLHGDEAIKQKIHNSIDNEKNETEAYKIANNYLKQIENREYTELCYKVYSDIKQIELQLFDILYKNNKVDDFNWFIINTKEEINKVENEEKQRILNLQSILSPLGIKRMAQENLKKKIDIWIENSKEKSITQPSDEVKTILDEMERINKRDTEILKIFFHDI